jgi:hypothetical protein
MSTWMIDDPASDDELVFATDFYARKFGGRRAGSCTELLCASLTLTVDDTYRGNPEAGVAGVMRRRGYRVTSPSALKHRELERAREEAIRHKERERRSPPPAPSTRWRSERPLSPSRRSRNGASVNGRAKRPPGRRSVNAGSRLSTRRRRRWKRPSGSMQEGPRPSKPRWRLLRRDRKLNTPTGRRRRSDWKTRCGAREVRSPGFASNNGLCGGPTRSFGRALGAGSERPSFCVRTLQRNRSETFPTLSFLRSSNIARVEYRLMAQTLVWCRRLLALANACRFDDRLPFRGLRGEVRGQFL